MKQENRYALWLNRLIGDDVLEYRKIVHEFGSEYEVFCAAQQRKIVTSDEALNDRMQDAAQEEKIDLYIKWLVRHEVKVATYLDEEYPPLLKEIYDPPTVLFYRGTLPSADQITLGVVGTRKNTLYGEKVTKDICFDLAQQGACIVSGMAYGIDAIASQSALLAGENPCPTVAVLGCGVDVIYPSDNESLYSEIINQGAVISEFAPGMAPLPHHFPRRNRIISGMSHGVVVIEAGERSGAVITANAALDQGRDVFAVPGRIFDSKSVGTNRLIRDGLAKTVLSTNDILEEYGLSTEELFADQNVNFNALSDVEQSIVELLKQEEYAFDEICQMLEIDVKELNCALTSLEFSEIIKQLPGRIYGLAR